MQNCVFCYLDMNLQSYIWISHSLLQIGLECQLSVEELAVEVQRSFCSETIYANEIQFVQANKFQGLLKLYAYGTVWSFLKLKKFCSYMYGLEWLNNIINGLYQSEKKEEALF